MRKVPRGSTVSVSVEFQDLDVSAVVGFPAAACGTLNVEASARYVRGERDVGIPDGWQCEESEPVSFDDLMLDDLMIGGDLKLDPPVLQRLLEFVHGEKLREIQERACDAAAQREEAAHDAAMDSAFEDRREREYA